MNSNEIELRLRILRGDVLRVVKFNILGQKQLEDDEHAFLYTHTERLDAASLVHWLAYKPSHVSPIVDALVALIPSGHEGTLLAAYEIGPRAAHMSREAIRLLAERLLPRLAPRGWWHVAQHLDDGCPTFTALLAEPRGCELAAALFRYRDNEEACCSALRRLLGQLDLAARAHAIAWLESRGLLALVEPGDVLPTEVAFAFERDALADEGEEDSGRFFLDLALRWHGAGALVARDWYITQVLAAVKRGMPWVQLARALPVDVLDDVALRSFEAPPIAPWIWMVIEDAIERGDPDAWPRAFSLIDRSEATLGDGDHDHDPDLEPCVFYAHRKGRAARLSGQMGPTIILFHSSPPADADEEFEERVRLRAERPGLRGHALLWLNGRDGALFHRFASFPLTQERANRLMRWAVRKPRLFRGAGEIIIRLAQIADPLPPEALPAVTVFFPERPSPALLDAYRRLGGKAAEERLIAWMSAPIDGLEPLDEALPRSPEDLWLMTFDRAEVLPDLVTDDLRRKLGDGIGALQLRSLLSVHREAPWLLDEAQLVARVMDRADDLDDRWMSSRPIRICRPSLPRPSADACRSCDGRMSSSFSSTGS